jgi:predicted metal-dependent phosphoesterase TrpH
MTEGTSTGYNLESTSFQTLGAERAEHASRLRDVIDAGAGVDLHSHSRNSDGDWTPGELVADAKKIGLSLISLSDHDTVAGQETARRAAAEEGLLFLTGIEVSVTVERRLYHILGYDLDPTSPTWERFAAKRARQFEAYHLQTFELARQRGYAVDPDVARSPDGRFRDRPLAIALERAGLAPSLEAAQQLARSILPPRPAELTYLDVFEFADLLVSDEAVFSVAHPARNQAGVSVRLSEDDLRTILRALPLVALEATHPYHAAADVAHYADLAAKFGLAVTCGSDAHGQRHRRPLQRYPAILCRDFLEQIHERWVARARIELVVV